MIVGRGTVIGVAARWPLLISSKMLLFRGGGRLCEILQESRMEVSAPIKQLKTAKELEAMILEDLRAIDGCPAQGVNVTVYGIPWKAMLMFGVAAGPVRNKDDLKQIFEFITERLQRLYEIKVE
jgi:hypothetical protein